MKAEKKIVIASHRLPVQIKNSRPIPSDGGLVSAIQGAGLSEDSVWVGSLGENVMDATHHSLGGNYVPVSIHNDMQKGFYNGFCNQVIWPAFHDRVDLVDYNKTDWIFYRCANRRFVDAIIKHTREDAPVWVHDYHLMLVPELLKEKQPGRKVGFFLHIPWPKLEVAIEIPHLAQIARALLSADTVAFHTELYKTNFKDFAEHFGLMTRASLQAIPVGIAADEFRLPLSGNKGPRKSEVTRIIGVDRFDYTKGIDFKLLAFNDFLEMHPEYCGRVVLDQLLIPSREDIPAYQSYRREVMNLVEYINRKYAREDWKPVHIRVDRMKRAELVDFYRSGDICFISSAKDGMNLVSMEYLAAQAPASPGIVVMSDQIGAANFLQAALKFKAHSLEEALRQLRRAFDMSDSEKDARYKKDIQWVRKNSARTWALKNLEALGLAFQPSVATMGTNAPAS